MGVRYKPFEATENKAFEDERIPQKVVVVGDGGCGKTCLLTVFTTGTFPDEYFPTVFETNVTDVVVNGKQVALELWDTAGQEEYDRLRPLFYPDSKAVIICFDVSNLDSLSNVDDRWIPEVRYFCPDVPVVLVGTKLDLRQNSSSIKRLSDGNTTPIVTETEGRAMASRIGASCYVECSARQRQNVDEVFRAAADAIATRKNQLKACTLL